VQLSPGGLEVLHISGPEPLDLRYQVPAGDALLEHNLGYGAAPDLLEDEQGRWLQVMLGPGQRINISVNAQQISVHAPDRREEQTGNGTESVEPAAAR
jgi:hypothetical protein